MGRFQEFGPFAFVEVLVRLLFSDPLVILHFIGKIQILCRSLKVSADGRTLFSEEMYFNSVLLSHGDQGRSVLLVHRLRRFLKNAEDPFSRILQTIPLCLIKPCQKLQRRDPVMLPVSQRDDNIIIFSVLKIQRRKPRLINPRGNVNILKEQIRIMLLLCIQTQSRQNCRRFPGKHLLLKRRSVLGSHSDIQLTVQTLPGPEDSLKRLDANPAAAENQDILRLLPAVGFRILTDRSVVKQFVYFQTIFSDFIHSAIPPDTAVQFLRSGSPCAKVIIYPYSHSHMNSFLAIQNRHFFCIRKMPVCTVNFSVFTLCYVLPLQT